MDTERNEDLNPRSDDIEERVKRMLDPSVPDEPDTTPSATVKKGKAIKIQAVSSEAGSNDTAALSAPVLPEPDQKKTPAKPASKKVIIPISHDSEASSETPAAEPVAEVSEAEPPDAVQEIKIDDDTTDPADIAEKLDEAIAELEPLSKPTDETAESETVEAAVKAPKAQAPETEAADATVDEPKVISDPETDKAVDAIIADESDELLEMEDAIRDSDEPVATAKEHRSLWQTLAGFWSKSAVRWGLLLLIIALVLAAGIFPTTRYLALNTVGLRAGSSLTVLDDSTQQPLKNVQVKIGNVSAITDANGQVKFNKVRLGANFLSVEKRAFAPITKTVTLGLGSNPLGEFRLSPTGTQYSFKVTDYLSAKPMAKVEAASGDASALSDNNGVIKLTLDKPDDEIKVTLKSEDYRSEELTISAEDRAQHEVRMVPARKQLFISKRSGRYDIYSVYIDGQDEQLILAGSGKERDDMILVPHPGADVAAYVSTRAGQSNNEGYLLSNLLLIDTKDKTTTNIGASERIQIVDWSGDYLIYVKIAAGTSASSPNRYRLMSYNYKEETEKELASSNFFNDVVFAQGLIYYAPSGAYQTSPANFYKVKPDGSGGGQVVFNKEVWNIFRTSYDHFALAVQQQWYDYALGGSQPTKLNSAPSDQTTRVYIDSPDGKHSLWVDSRDGKGVLLSYDTVTKTDTTLKSQTGITYPVRWLNNKVLVYRVKSPQETADYAISTDGGEPVKIRDVTNAGGIDRWYYY